MQPLHFFCACAPRNHPRALVRLIAGVSVAVGLACGSSGSPTGVSSGEGAAPSGSSGSHGSGVSTAGSAASSGNSPGGSSSTSSNASQSSSSTTHGAGSSSSSTSSSSMSSSNASSSGSSSAASSSSSSSSSGALPGDIAASADTPVVAAHSLTRALFAAYSGRLFQVRRASDGTTHDIGTASTGGQVDLATLSSFCAGTTCSVSILYDQTANGNDLKSGLVLAAATTDNGPATANNEPAVQYWATSNGTQLPMAVTLNDDNQHPGGQWLRNRNATRAIPTGSQSQTEYMVVHAAYVGGQCCYDYGNMENHISDDGPGTMNALYFGNSNSWTQGAGAGPWAMADMENGLFAGGGSIQDPNNGNGLNVNASDPSIKYSGNNIASVLTKTNGTSTWELKVGDAATGALQTAWSGSLPTVLNPTSYIPLHQEGGLSLGEGGDGSNDCTGAFSEGVVIAGETTDATDDAIQTNLNAVYGQ